MREHRNALMAIMGDYFAHRANSVGPMVNFLLERGAIVNSPPSGEYTSALHASIRQCNSQFVDRLLEAGADVNAHHPRFGTALTAAAFWGHVGVIKALIERGADLTLAGEKYGLVAETPWSTVLHPTDTFTGPLCRPQRAVTALRLSSSF